MIKCIDLFTLLTKILIHLITICCEKITYIEPFHTTLVYTETLSNGSFVR